MNFHKLALFTTFIAFIAIMLGAYTRLSDAGLGCPDWPGCYGQLSVPETQSDMQRAKEAFPAQAIETEKAWKEMSHRYVAGTLGILILSLAIMAWKNRRQAQQAIILPTILVGIVIFQALLGMWTVTLLLKPLVVVVHLLFGFTTLALLFWLTIGHSLIVKFNQQENNQGFRIAAALGVFILVVQIALGGWTSSNYAALVCPDLPTCQASWWPEMNFKEAFILWRGIGINYEGGVLDFQARTAIHVVHRIGALITFSYLMILGVSIYFKSQNLVLSRTGMAISIIVCIQFALGLSNVFFSLPIAVAVAHNSIAAILLLSLVWLNFQLYHKVYQSK